MTCRAFNAEYFGSKLFNIQLYFHERIGEMVEAYFFLVSLFDIDNEFFSQK